MGYDLQRLRDLRALPAMTDFLRRVYPKMDKPLLSKTMNEGYGVQLKPEALKALAEEFDPEGWAHRKTDGHLLRFSVRCRMSKEEFDALTARYKADGYPNANACFRALMWNYLHEVE